MRVKTLKETLFTPQEQEALFKAIDDVEKGKSNLVEFEITNHKVKVIRHRSYVKITLTKLKY